MTQQSEIVLKLANPTSSVADHRLNPTYIYGLENHRDRILFLEIDPGNQPSFRNLLLLSRFMSQGDPAQGPLILDPQDVYFEGDPLHYRWEGRTGRINKVISRLVDADKKRRCRARLVFQHGGYFGGKGRTGNGRKNYILKEEEL